ncbi:uncharacterized protein C10orf67 homolog, mitochondrial isoform X1 [Lissotriton helveticus]
MKKPLLEGTSADGPSGVKDSPEKVNRKVESGQALEGAVCAGPEDVHALEAFVAGALQIRLSISDQLRIGFYHADNATQTDASEILKLKELANVTQTLTKSFDLLKRDILFHKTALQAYYEEEIKEQGLHLYLRMNGTVRDLETVHKKKLIMMRQSFRQQLSDALARIHATYEDLSVLSKSAYKVSQPHRPNSDPLGVLYRVLHFIKYYSVTTKRVDDKEDFSFDTKEDLAANFQSLLSTLRLKEQKISSLEAQLLGCQEREYPTQIIYEPEYDLEKDLMLDENKKFKEKIKIMMNSIVGLEDQLAKKRKEIRALEMDVRHMKEKIETDQKTIEKLSASLEKAKTELEKEKYSSALLVQNKKEETKIGLAKKLKDTEKKEAQSETEVQKQQQMLLLEQKQLLLLQQEDKHHHDEEELAVIVKNEKRIAGRRILDPQNQKLQKVVEEQTKTIESLRKEVEQNIRISEKKIDIFKKSIHALKDEMFLRQSLQRHAANVNRMSVNYAPQTGSSSIIRMVKADFDMNIASGAHHYSPKEEEMQFVSDAEDNLGEPPFLPSPTDRASTSGMAALLHPESLRNGH